MTKHDPLLNARHNVSERIREAHAQNPAATNHEIKQVLMDVHGLEVGSNLIIQTIGSERERQPLVQRRAKIIPLAKDLLEACEGNKLVAQNLLNQVVS